MRTKIFPRFSEHTEAVTVKRCSVKKSVLKNFADFTRHLRWSFIKNRLQHRCFPVKFAKFLRTPIWRNICERGLLNTEGVFSVFCRRCCSALINAVMKYGFFRSSGSKLESVTWKFTNSCTPSQVFFKDNHHSCRRAILKKVSWWLLLRTNLFWKHPCMSASQKQLRTYIRFRNSYTYFTFLTLTLC